MNKTSIEVLAKELQFFLKETNDISKKIQEKEETLNFLKNKKDTMLKKCLEILEDIKHEEDEKYIYYDYKDSTVLFDKGLWCLDD